MKIEFKNKWLYDNKIAIECKTKEEANIIWDIFYTTIESTKYSEDNVYFSTLKDFDNYVGLFHRDILIAKTIIQASEVIAQYEASKPKIIGYKAPFDMYQQENDFLVNKGDLYIIAHEVSNCYAPKKWIECDLPKDIKTLYIPFEIIEKLFEPVYEEVKPFFASFDDLICYLVKKGEKFESIKFGDEIIDKSKYDFTPEFESKLKEMGINI